MGDGYTFLFILCMFEIFHTKLKEKSLFANNFAQ